ncbi:hypothetical protein Tco_0980516 [Tanacetum coccineum]
MWSKPGGLTFNSFVAAGLLLELSILCRDASLSNVLLPLILLASFFARLFKMTKFAAKHSIMTLEMVENFCNDYYIPDEAHRRDKTITQFPEGKVGVYTRTADRLEGSKCIVRKFSEDGIGSSVKLQDKNKMTRTSSAAALDECDCLTYAAESDTLPASIEEGSRPALLLVLSMENFPCLCVRPTMPTSPLVSRPSFQADIQAHVCPDTTECPVYTAAADCRMTPFIELPAMNSAEAKRWLLEEKDLEILGLKSLLVEEAKKAERAKTAEVVHLHGQVSALTEEVSTLHTAFQDFKKKAEAQQEEQAQVLYNRVVPLEALREGAKKHAAPLRLAYMMEIVYKPQFFSDLGGVKLVLPAAPLIRRGIDEWSTDEALGSVVAIPKFKACRF